MTAASDATHIITACRYRCPNNHATRPLSVYGLLSISSIHFLASFSRMGEKFEMAKLEYCDDSVNFVGSKLFASRRQFG